MLELNWKKGIKFANCFVCVYVRVCMYVWKIGKVFGEYIQRCILDKNWALRLAGYTAVLQQFV